MTHYSEIKQSKGGSGLPDLQFSTDSLIFTEQKEPQNHSIYQRGVKITRRSSIPQNHHHSVFHVVIGSCFTHARARTHMLLRLSQ